MRNFRPLSDNNVDILAAHFKLCGWLDLKVSQLEAKMAAFLREETKVTAEKVKLEESHNHWFKVNGSDSRFSEDHFIGNTGVRY